MSELEEKLSKYLTIYKLTSDEKCEFFNIIEPIYKHAEFQKRMNPQNFPHHGKTSLGEHILSDALVTYVLAKKKFDKGKKVDVELSVIIAMFHDLYELPWQNNDDKKNKFINKHGFVHPIEAIINASIWYPSYFDDEMRKERIIDGVIHHMYPFPVRGTDKDFEEIEIHNFAKLKDVKPEVKKIILESCNRFRIGKVSLSKSKYIEGRIMAKADKVVTYKNEIQSLNSLMALITGKNSDLDNYSKKQKKK